MPEPGPLLARSRAALLDALEALEGQRRAVIVVGAQAVYLHTGVEDSAIATVTKDSDLVLDPNALEDDPCWRRRCAVPASSKTSRIRSPAPG